MRISTKAGAVLGSCLLLAGGTVLAAAPGSVSEKRGFDRCVKAVEGEYAGIRVERSYYVNAREESRQFYLNARGLRDGAWGSIRIACETNRTGHQVRAVKHEAGRYLGRTSPAIAQN
jgi:hypothetical protein